MSTILSYLVGWDGSAQMLQRSRIGYKEHVQSSIAPSIQSLFAHLQHCHPKQSSKFIVIVLTLFGIVL